MTELLELIEKFGATTVLSGFCIYLFHRLNQEREELLNKLDERTRDFLNSLNNITNKIDDVKEELRDIKERIDK